jgi:hypothetical protein
MASSISSWNKCLLIRILNPSHSHRYLDNHQNPDEYFHDSFFLGGYFMDPEFSPKHGGRFVVIIIILGQVGRSIT